MPIKSGPSRRAALQASAACASPPTDTIAGWRERELIDMDDMSTVSGLSRGTIYNLHHRGLLRLRRVAGRTVARPDEFVAALREAEEVWSPDKHGGRGAAARAARRATTQPTEAT